MSIQSVLLALAANALIGGACTGAGSALLTALDLIRRLDRLEAIAWSFGVGLGLLGWAAFFLGLSGTIQPEVLSLVALGAVPFSLLIRRAPRTVSDNARSPVVHLLLWGCAAALLTIDLSEALSPPADADSLAYHFALPEQFLAAGRLEFVPRAVDGAVPLLVQMTYMVALALGGELAMTFWAGLTGWMAGLLTFAAARPFVGRSWAAAVALLFLSAPAMLYSGGTGQVEPRLAIFALLAAFSVARGICSGEMAYALLAGLCAGFFAGAKYTGLLFVAAAAMPILLFWRSPKAVMLFAVGAAVAGLQWYVWNWWHTGDPVFPALYSFLGLPDGPYWSADQDQQFRTIYHGSENPLPRSLLWLLAYPFHATLAPVDAIESGRTGLGPYGLLVLPFVLAGVWHWRSRILQHPLSAVALIVFVFYVLWFASGVSQRVRHLLPVWPLFLICVTAVAVRWSRKKGQNAPLAAAAGLSIAIHLAGQATFGFSYLRHLAGRESRDEFLERTVSFYGFVRPTEEAMGPNDRVLTDLRQLVYLFEKPVFYFHRIDQSQIVARNGAHEPARFLRELRAQGVTLLLILWPVGTTEEPNDLAQATAALTTAGCAEAVRTLSARPIGSRTLGMRGSAPVPAILYRLKERGCGL